MNERTQKELTDIWTDKISVAAALVVVIPLVIYFLGRYGFFDGFNSESWADIKYIVTGPGLFFVGVAYAPVWIVSAFYLVFLVMKFIITAIRILYRVKTEEGPRTVSRKELINRLKY